MSVHLYLFRVFFVMLSYNIFLQLCSILAEQLACADFLHCPLGKSNMYLHSLRILKGRCNINNFLKHKRRTVVVFDLS